MSEEAMREEVAQAVEVAANKAAVGGSANVFVHTSAGVVALSVVEYKPNEEE